MRFVHARSRDSRLAGLAAAAAVLVATLCWTAAAATGCSALVQFRDQPSCDGGLCENLDASQAPPPRDASEGGAVAEASPVDATPKPSAPCSNLRNGYYCANDGPNGFTGPPTDLLYCADGGIGKATPCDGGCLHIPDPFPDACNPCPGVANGLYCGRDLKGFPADNADFLIQCQNGDTVQQVACIHGCGSNGVMSACNPG
jgi:hypothetical protein